MHTLRAPALLLLASAVASVQSQDFVERFGAANLDRPVPADFDGDGKADLAVYRSSTAEWIIKSSRTRTAWRTSFGAHRYDLPVPADYDGDGRADLAVYRPSTSEWIVRGSTTGLSRVVCGSRGDIPMPADYDGDGKTDRATCAPGSKMWTIFGSKEGLATINFMPWSQFIPTTGDFDGDGRANLVMFDPYMLDFEVRWPDGSRVFIDGGNHGGSVDTVPLVADFDGDGLADPAYFSYDRVHAETTTLRDFAVQGSHTATRVPADYNGDGAVDFAEYEASSGVWRVWFSELAPKLQSFELHQQEIESGFSVPGTATFDRPAGREIVLTFSTTGPEYQNPVRANVVVPQGSTSVNFLAPTLPVPTASTVTIESQLGARRFQSHLQVSPGFGLQSFTVDKAQFTMGDSVVGTLSLGGTAPAGGATVSLKANIWPATAISYPETVTVPEGASSATFNITSPRMYNSGGFDLLASFRNTTKVVTLFPRPTPPTILTLTGGDVFGGDSGTINYQLEFQTPGVQLFLSRTHSDVVSLPSNVMLGTSLTGSIPFTTKDLGKNAVCTIYAYVGNGPTKTATLQVRTRQGVQLSRFTTPDQVQSGSSFSATLQLTGPAPTGGATAYLAHEGRLTGPTTATFAAGETSKQLSYYASSVYSPSTARIVATWNGLTIAKYVNLLPILGLQEMFYPSEVKSEMEHEVVLKLSLPAPAGGVQVAFSPAGTLLTPAVVPEGAREVTVRVRAIKTSTPLSRSVRASYGGNSQEKLVTIVP